MGLRHIVRVLQDVVVLSQEKNILAEIHGEKNYTKVGEIERELDWPLQLQEKYGKEGSTEYFSKKLRMQADEHNAVLNMINEDIKIHDTTRKEMIAFLTKALGHENQGWVKILEARWGKRKRGLSFVGPEAKAERKVVPSR